MPKHQIFDSKANAIKTIPINTIRNIQIDGKQYCLANTVNGFISFQKECNHAGGNLSKGALNAYNQIVCPLHAYMFDLKSGEEDNRKCKHIHIYQTIWENGSLYVLL